MTSTILVSVDDSGPGVPSDELERIFDRFYRGERSRRREDPTSGGAGLGLAIARGLVQAHSGRIWAERSPLGGMSVQIQFADDDDQPRRGATTGASAGTLSSMSSTGSPPIK